MITKRAWDFGEVHVEALVPASREVRVAYLLEPVKVLPSLEDLAEETALVSVFGMDWERDLTPWPAPRAYKRGADFTGGADAFRSRLTEEIIPAVEHDLGIVPTGRTLVGISLAGLFAVQTAFLSNRFDTLCSISGSLWYDDFLDWMEEQTLSPSVRSMYLSLGAEEKNTRNPRLACVEDRTLAACRLLRAQGLSPVFELNPGNHFSDGPLRLRKALLACR